MKHKNIAIFIPHVGCKNDCSFCNQRTISGTIQPPTKDEVRDILLKASNDIQEKSSAEIAFFGGSFTAIPKKYMQDLLSVANEFIGNGKFSGIRISTRPDCISQEILELLKQYNVTAIELGAQSMDDTVLQANDRGHTAQDVIEASKLIQQNHFELGLQMMVGLYQDSRASVIKTAKEIVKIYPDTVRIYPTVILKGTKLAYLYQSGEYCPMPLQEAVSICAELLELFDNNDIKVIKLGLHASADVERDMTGGIYHPAFRELCENEMFYKKALKLIKDSNQTNVIIEVHGKNLSKMIGQKKSNLLKLKELGIQARVLENNNLTKNQIIIKKDVQPCY
ncbi:radical SAM protein [Paludicola sp. MB14-C6]|uniref:elongator complex protein 3 n=1 Tax=Paludihabitans sp. MB14-C6 TaxID=3070656 RepID=UPI0027DCBA5A|nr:radical SAM protein [Paludicola sp. MB14-C6]WMJ23684.1 radical SAM protein [Paludicola sp. MB14-C6]